MNGILGPVTRVVDILGEIAAASDEQSRGISQVGIAITQMDTVTQQNGVLVEQAAVSATAFADQADALQILLAVFQVAG